jgi:hypothetical protein
MLLCRGDLLDDEWKHDEKKKVYRGVSRFVIYMHERPVDVGQDFYLVLQFLADIMSFP